MCSVHSPIELQMDFSMTNKLNKEERIQNKVIP
jgi:hypothetical protein